MAPQNIDPQTVAGFGEEWAAFDQHELDPDEHRRLFRQYFAIMDFGALPADAEGFDLGCGTGRWAILVAERVGHLHCIDPAEKALAVARRRLSKLPNVSFHLASGDAIPLADASQDFGYSLGVLHHIPDTARAMADAVRKLKPGAPFLVYIYYDFEQRPRWYRWLWKASDVGRRLVSKLPFPVRKATTTAIAGLVYWPLSRTAGLLERRGMDVAAFPLSEYRYRSFYSLKTDALDRFGTRLEQRFSRAQITRMMAQAGLVDIAFSDESPFWVACGWKAPRT